MTAHPAPFEPGVSPRVDRAIQASALIIAVLVMIASGVLSFASLEGLAREAGISAQYAWLFPLSVDLSTVSGSLLTLVAALKNSRSVFGWGVIALGTSWSVFANTQAPGAHASTVTLLVHGSAPILFLAALESSLHLLRRRVSLSAQHAAIAAETLARAEAKAERERLAAERAAERERVETARAEAAREKAVARQAAVSTANAVLGRTKDSGRAAEIATYAGSVEGWGELSIPKRIALIVARFEGVAVSEIVASSTCMLVDGEEARRTAKRIHKSIGDARAGAAVNAAGSGPRRLTAVGA